MSEIPDKIYLQNPENYEESSWCEERVGHDDIKYVRFQPTADVRELAKMIMEYFSMSGNSIKVYRGGWILSEKSLTHITALISAHVAEEHNKIVEQANKRIEELEGDIKAKDEEIERLQNAFSKLNSDDVDEFRKYDARIAELEKALELVVNFVKNTGFNLSAEIELQLTALDGKEESDGYK